jgi:predicted O-methyltransferase YrrM
MNIIRQGIDFIGWWKSAKTRHGIHSPFLYQFMDECLYVKSDHLDFVHIEKLRKQFLRDKNTIHFLDMGAGYRNKQQQSKEPAEKSRRICDIASSSLQSPHYCRLFYRMIQYFKISSVLELGTSLGITTSYMAAANPNARIDTIEGAETIANIANQVFQKNNYQNIRLHVGHFDDLLAKIKDHIQYQLILIDGNHRGEATMNYFLWSLKHIHPQGVVIVDDIRWSKSMYQTWQTIQQHPQVSLTVDLFFMGLVFFDNRLSKENFKIRF